MRSTLRLLAPLVLAVSFANTGVAAMKCDGGFGAGGYGNSEHVIWKFVRVRNWFSRLGFNPIPAPTGLPYTDFTYPHNKDEAEFWYEGHYSRLGRVIAVVQISPGPIEHYFGVYFFINETEKEMQDEYLDESRARKLGELLNGSAKRAGE